MEWQATITATRPTGLSRHITTARYHGYGQTAADAMAEAKSAAKADKATAIGKPRLSFRKDA
jgi:hypothetical protein